ncbi:MAG TPA: ergothioneine biosynthesis protein EgtB [Steroidobacteraceae bacterium]|nr:ergothioneine biosynthesis protein EgtB [Steroidobacteraceae bacterium]
MQPSSSISSAHARRSPRERNAASDEERYRSVRAATVELCAPLANEDYVVQSMPDASPAKWHLAHTSWFFEEFVLARALAGYRPYAECFRYLFNSYYNTVGPMHSRAARGMLSRPTVAEVMAYRAAIDERMASLLSAGELPGELERVVTLGLEHERQHQELLLTDIKHLYSLNPLLPAYREPPPPPRPLRPAPLRYLRFEGGITGIGHAGPAFCFDNELPRHRALIAPFRLANRPVINGEYLEFVRAGGYADARLWLSDGWALARREEWLRPIYWSRSLEEEFTLTGERELDPDAPLCHVSYYEADAFARWAGARLPTEFEWELAAGTVALTGNFVERREWHPQAADMPAASSCAPDTLLQMFGDVWEWTQSAYAPYPGYSPAAGALGEYNGKFMINQLVLRGGSCATPREHVRASYRNFFPPAARWQFSGVRLAGEGLTAETHDGP